MKNFIIIFLFASLFLLSCTNRDKISPEQNNKTDQTLADDQTWFENKGFNDLYHSFEDTYATRSGKRVKVKKYPDYYGGAYIADDQNTVVIIIANDNPSKYEKEFINRLNHSPFRIEKGNFSYNALLDIDEKFGEFLRDNKNADIIQNIVSGSIRDDKNIYVIELEDCNLSKIDEMKKRFIDSPAVRYEEADKSINASSINPGGRILIYESNQSASIGYRVRSNIGESGFVTAGHGGNVNNNIYIGNTNIGKIILHKNRDDVDASFVKIVNTSYTASNTTVSGITINPQIPGLSVGSTINIEGSVLGRQFGRIESTSARIIIDGQEFYDMIRVSTNELQLGDSGGISYTNMFNLIGIVKSKRNNTAHLVKASNINRTFRLTPY